MKLFAVGENVVLKQVEEKKAEITEGKIIIPTKKTSTKLYEVVQANGVFEVGDIVAIKGFPQIVELEEQEYYLVPQESIIAVIRQS